MHRLEDLVTDRPTEQLDAKGRILVAIIAGVCAAIAIWLLAAELLRIT